MSSAEQQAGAANIVQRRVTIRPPMHVRAAARLLASLRYHGKRRAINADAAAELQVIAKVSISIYRPGAESE